MHNDSVSLRHQVEPRLIKSSNINRRLVQVIPKMTNSLVNRLRPKGLLLLSRASNSHLRQQEPQ